MIKVLIADDEPRIRRGIMRVVEWNQLGFEIVAEAEDGEIALLKAIETKPDLLLIDICMPFINGLELISKLNEQLNSPTIIIISGHDEFQYAQTAVKLRVFDYILKPVNKEIITETILRAKEKIIRRKGEEIENQFALTQLKRSSEYLKDKFMIDWINGKLNKEQIISQVNYFNIQYTHNMGIVAIRLIDKNISIIEDGWNVDLLCYAIANIAKEIMEDFKNLITFRDDRNQVIIISDINPIIIWNQIAVKIEKSLYQYLKKEVLIETSLLPIDMMRVTNVYKEICINLVEKSQKTPIVISIQKYINESYKNPELSLNQISDKIGISHTYITRLLKQELGMSFIDYVTQVRIKNAITLMEDPAIKMYEVAEMVGYSSQHYFSNVFKKLVGMSPVEYKRGGKYDNW